MSMLFNEREWGALMAAHSTYEAYSTDPFEYDGLEDSEDFSTAADAQDDTYLEELADQVEKQFPHLAEYRFEMKDAISTGRYYEYRN